MNINNYNQYGGNFIEHVDVHDCTITLSSDGQLSSALCGERESVDTVVTTPPQPTSRKPITEDIVQKAILSTLTFTHDRKRVFCKKYHWHSIFRILYDEGYITTLTTFIKGINQLIPPETMKRLNMEQLILQDTSILSRYNIDYYAKNFSQWKKTLPFSTTPDPRYLLAEHFKETLYALRSLP